METTGPYLDRKAGEIALLDACLAAPGHPVRPATPGMAIDRKFRLAAALRSERALQGWDLTETARFPGQRGAAGAYEFSFAYQRADLQVQGPAIYAALPDGDDGLLQHTSYAACGMSAMAALFTALLRVREPIEVLLPRGCYFETRELLDGFGARVCAFPLDTGLRHWSPGGPMRVALLDSAAPEGLPRLDCLPELDLVIFDTSCYWRSSSSIRRVAAWAREAKLPLALVRSHTKLDCLGVEYGRLGSVVLAAPVQGVLSGRLRWIGALGVQLADAVRLLGVAPSPASFPPFAQQGEFERLSRARMAAAMRNNRRMARRLRAAFGEGAVKLYRHGLYFTVEPGRPLARHALRLAAAELCESLAARAQLPVAHAGSFGFDFVAVDVFTDPASLRDVLRIAAADLPPALSEQIAARIVRWLSRRGLRQREGSFFPALGDERPRPAAPRRRGLPKINRPVRLYLRPR